jgi:hypothetical protein
MTRLKASVNSDSTSELISLGVQMAFPRESGRAKRLRFLLRQQNVMRMRLRTTPKASQTRSLHFLLSSGPRALSLSLWPSSDRRHLFHPESRDPELVHLQTYHILSDPESIKDYPIL